MQNFSLLTSEIPELEQFKDWNLYRVSQSELLNACKIVIAYVRRLKFCMWIFFTISKLFCYMSADIARKLAESASAYRGRARISPRTQNKIGSKLQKNVTWTRKSTLSFELIILELFDCFTSLRVAGCLSAALKRQPNEAGNKYSELYTYFKLVKKISPRYL